MTAAWSSPPATTWFSLRWPREVSSEQLLAGLLAINGLSTPGRREPIVLRTIGTDEGVEHQLVVPERRADSLQHQVEAAVPGLGLDRLDEPPVLSVDRAWRMWLSTTRRPLRFKDPEPLATGLLTALGSVATKELVAVQWVLGPVRRPLAVASRTPGNPGHGVDLARALTAGLADLDVEARTALTHKQALPGWRACFIIGVSAKSALRRRQLFGRVAAVLRTAQAPSVQLGFHACRPGALVSLPLRWPVAVNIAELVGLTAWPIGPTTDLPVARVGARQLKPAKGSLVSEAAMLAMPERYRVIGKVLYPGVDGFAHLPIQDATQHLHVIGPTGSGKSVLLSRLIKADIDAGRGVVVIEPKADLIRAVLDLIPEHRLDEVVLIDPTDKNHAVGLNVLGGDPELAADRLVSLMAAMFRDSWGPRTAQMIHAAAYTLAAAGDLTICELPLLLTSEPFRRSVLARVNDPLGVGPIWSWFDSLGEAQQMNVVGPSLNKLSAFVGRRAIRSILGQAKPAFELRQLFTKRRIVLINLAKGLVGPEAARLLGALVFSALWQEILGRSAAPPEKRHPVPVYVDEFADYVKGVTVDLSEMLAQARGLGAPLTLAHQGLHQMDRTLRDAVLTDARSRVVYRPTRDAKALAEAVGGGLTADDVQSLGAYQAYATLMRGGSPTGPVAVATLPPLKPLGTAERARARSRQQWARPIADVEAELLARRQPARAAEAFGGQRRRQP